jgi:hypothetical protein
MFTSANYQLIRSNCTDSNVHGNNPGKASVKRQCEPEEVHNLYLLFGLVKIRKG